MVSALSLGSAGPTKHSPGQLSWAGALVQDPAGENSSLYSPVTTGTFVLQSSLIRYLYKWEGMRAWRVLDKLEVTHLSWDVSIFHLKQLWNIFHPGWWRINPVNVREVHKSWNVARRQEETSQHCDVVATPERDLAAFGNVPRNNEYVKLL